MQETTRTDDRLAGPKANVLLVDDKPANLLALEALLQDLGHNLVQARSGEDALSRLREAEFALVLLAVRIPGLDGFQTARLIRGQQRSQHTPIIFVSSHEDDEFPATEAYKLGAVDYLIKPLVPEVVRAKVEGLVDLFQEKEQARRQADQLRLLVQGTTDYAMRRPSAGKAHRPRHVHVRGHPQWRELFPHLNELGIEVAVHRELSKVQEAYRGYLRQQREAHRKGMVKPSAAQQSIEELFPAIARWVRGYGHIEIGDQEMFGYIVRALDYGGVVFEDDKPDTLAEAMVALEKGLTRYFERKGIDLEGS